MTDYTVVPDALRKNVKFLQDASDAWEKAQKALKGMELSQDDLGLLGGASGATRNHNNAIEEAHTRLKEGQDVLEGAARSLKSVADDYESRDAAFYEKFGYIADQI